MPRKRREDLLIDFDASDDDNDGREEEQPKEASCAPPPKPGEAVQYPSPVFVGSQPPAEPRAMREAREVRQIGSGPSNAHPCGISSVPSESRSAPVSSPQDDEWPKRAHLKGARAGRNVQAKKATKQRFNLANDYVGGPGASGLGAALEKRLLDDGNSDDNNNNNEKKDDGRGTGTKQPGNDNGNGSLFHAPVPHKPAQPIFMPHQRATPAARKRQENPRSAVPHPPDPVPKQPEPWRSDSDVEREAAAQRGIASVVSTAPDSTPIEFPVLGGEPSDQSTSRSDAHASDPYVVKLEEALEKLKREGSQKDRLIEFLEQLVKDYAESSDAAYTMLGIEVEMWHADRSDSEIRAFLKQLERQGPERIFQVYDELKERAKERADKEEADQAKNKAEEKGEEKEQLPDGEKIGLPPGKWKRKE